MKQIMKILTLIILAICICSVLRAQDEIAEPEALDTNKYTIKYDLPNAIIKDANSFLEYPVLLDIMVLKHKNYNIKHPTIGYKIQIFSRTGNNSKIATINARNEFLLNFPDIKTTYISYEEPYFKVKIGNYRTYIEADIALDNLQKNYPNAFITIDKLDIENILTPKIEVSTANDSINSIIDSENIDATLEDSDINE